MSLKQRRHLNRVELLVTALIAGVGLFAVADGYSLLIHGASEASWTAAYVMASGTVLALLAAASLLPFSRRAAATSVSTRAADDVLEDKGGSCSEPALDEEVPLETARSLLLRTIVLLLVWVLVLPLIGYIVATAIFLFAYGLLVSRRRVMTTLVFAVVGTAASTALFHAVGIGLPMGSLF